MRKIIIDTDPGVDDAFTIFLAAQHPEIDLVGLTTVYGNVTTDQASNNALKLLEMAEMQHVPVAQGASVPLNGVEPIPADFVHGKDGFGNLHLPEAEGKIHNLSAAEFLVQKIMDNPNEVSICAIAPLTNLALALEIEPKIVNKVKQISVMGGAISAPGNVSPVAEANIFGDPDAADKVFTCGWDVTLIGLDVTMKVILDKQYLKRLKEHGGRMGEFLHDASQFYHDFYTTVRKLPGIAAHDPTALAYLLHPEYFSTKKGSLRVATDGIARGMTIFAEHPHSFDGTDWDNIPPVHVCTEVKVNKVVDFFTKHLYEKEIV